MAPWVITPGGSTRLSSAEAELSAAPLEQIEDPIGGSVVEQALEGQQDEPEALSLGTRRAAGIAQPGDPVGPAARGP